MDEYMNQVNSLIAQNNTWSAEQAQKQMDFQERMSNTAHQREIEDLKAAGLNPVLSAKLGGAQTPAGAMGTVDTSGAGALVDLLQLSMETAASAADAAKASAGGRSTGVGQNSADGASIFGLNPLDYVYKNPKNVSQQAWNAVMRSLSASGVQVDLETIQAYAKQFGVDLKSFFGSSAKSNSVSTVSRVEKPDGVMSWAWNSLKAGLKGKEAYDAYQKKYNETWNKYLYAVSHKKGTGKSQNR